MFVLEDKTYFWLFWVIPAVILLYLLTRVWRKHAQKKFADAVSLKKLSPDKSRFKPLLKLLLFLLALACFILALVNPKMGAEMKTVKRQGVDIVFAMDVSKSMLAEDIAPNRLDKSKQLVQQIINSLGGDRVGIVAYAGSAFPQLPITTDYGAANLFLKALNTNMVSSQGTAIDEAIDLGQTFYDDESETNRVMFIVSDGEDHGGNVEAMAEEAAKKDIRIFTILVGTPKGGRIPIKRNGVVRSFKKDKNGETVITKGDKTTLEKIAKATNGKFFNGRNTAEVVKEVNNALNNIEKSDYESKQYSSFEDQFQWFLGFGILFTVLNVFLLERKTGWLKRLDLFNEKNKDDVD